MSLIASSIGQEYATRSGGLVVLRDISLEMQPGQALAVMGPSGAGKSTLLHILGTLERPTRGSVRLAGQDPFALPEKELAAFRNQRIGFIFQDHHLLPQCSALENVLIPTLVSRSAGSDQEKRARQLLERVGLCERLEHRPAELSGGEKQRVAVARALMNHPLLLLADEPTGNLDRHTAEAVGGLLLELAQQEEAMLIAVTHSLDIARRFPSKMELLDGTLHPMTNGHAP
jgi:lipoprotein-releasing system ATP-binding protein